MLVLSRKKNESIVIDDNITLVVVEIRGDRVRLGIESPKEVSVHRREVYDAIQKNTGSQIRADLSEKFDRCLDNKEFDCAYEIYSSGSYFLNRDQKTRLLKGLGESNKSLKSKLQDYEGR